MGFQSKDPSTDFRGGGELALRNLVWFVETQPSIALPMMRRRRRPDNATAADTVTFKLEYNVINVYEPNGLAFSSCIVM